MRILIVGFLTFCAWSALSTYIYVCKIKGLCYEPRVIQVDAVNATNPISKPRVPEQTIMPKSLTIYFAFDKFEFAANPESEKYFDESNIYLNQNSQAKLSLTGYTDAIGSDEYNQELGYRRAQSLMNYFESRGILAKRIEIESKGEKDPVDNNSTSEGRAKNRRTVITIKK